MHNYLQHLNTLQQRYDALCKQYQLDGILISSGALTYYAGDDMSHPYKPAPFAQQWLPYNVDPLTWILITPGQKPVLYWPAQQDFWHVIPNAPEGPWTEHWQIEAAATNDWMSQLPSNIAILVNDPENLPPALSGEINPNTVVNALAYQRAYKTDWEVDQLTQANINAVKGHLAAEKAFYDGASEVSIHQAFLNASEQMQAEEPYSAIVGLNESAAVLHYERKNRLPPAEHRTLIIDAGAKINGYASDITRTVTNDTGLFKTLLDKMDTLEQELCAACTAGTDYLAVHQQTLVGIATILKETGICSHSVDVQLEKRIPQVFFPHGIGHLLGLQVHDIAGKQINSEGDIKPSPEEAPFLRLTRRLEDGMVITIEPGLYFIPMLINNMVENISDHGCNLDLIEQLKPFGGIRIEDNVLVKGDTPVNLTRNAYQQLANAD
ncbi:Xaa-Pro dipeptidase [Reinekea marina]|uniref:Xaa-Pro dipeptidase n=1 Tax=Reinekea marina TaxID=1310421 RepID=A0ABV7WXY5_9GAMM|nr:Xaa-Pro dipeptidase [Reinekea marina]MDN3649829.1 Xaa-Pro dipeptidase [Reinekea marina]